MIRYLVIALALSLVGGFEGGPGEKVMTPPGGGAVIAACHHGDRVYASNRGLAVVPGGCR